MVSTKYTILTSSQPRRKWIAITLSHLGWTAIYTDNTTSTSEDLGGHYKSPTIAIADSKKKWQCEDYIIIY